MEQSNEHEEICKQIKGSEQLFEIYVYFPTFHDAKIKKIYINYETREFSLTVDYCDFVKEPGDEISTRFIICWRNVRKANFNWYAEELSGIKFQKSDNYIKTIFSDYSFGFDGEIIAGEIEVKDIMINPEKTEKDIIKISME